MNHTKLQPRPNAAIRFLRGVNVLSLDAPLVALVWQEFWSVLFDAAAPLAERICLGLSVWIIYSLDRWMDNYSLPVKELRSRRHTFVKSHWKTYAIALASASGVLTVNVLWFLDPSTVAAGLWLGAACAVYLIGFHARGWSRQWNAAKEAAIAVLFTSGAAISVLSRMPEPTLPFLILFLMMVWTCFLNCLGISIWEALKHGKHESHSLVTRCPFVKRAFPHCAWISCLAMSAAGLAAPAPPTQRMGCFALALSCLGLYELHRRAGRMELETARVLADFCLLTPLLFHPFLIMP